MGEQKDGCHLQPSGFACPGLASVSSEPGYGSHSLALVPSTAWTHPQLNAHTGTAPLCRRTSVLPLLLPRAFLAHPALHAESRAVGDC